ncbi:MAG: HAD family hydrolase [Deltaproteobacteria bacterium]
MVINGRKIEGVIFDIDGTLVDSFPVYCSAFNRGIQQYNLEPVSSDFLVDALKRSATLLEVFRKVFPPQTDEALIERCRKEILELFMKAEVDEVKPFPGVRELFKNLRNNGIRIGVATGRTSLPEKEWERFKKYGLDGFIDSIVTSREVEKRKPAPDAILECANRLKVPIENCLVVGDTEADIIASKTAGAIAVAVSTGEGDIELLERENPEFLFKTLVDFDLFLNRP